MYEPVLVLPYHFVPGQWYTFARSGYTGASQWTPMVWSGDPDASFGDAEGLPAQMRAGNGGLWPR